MGVRVRMTLQAVAVVVNFRDTTREEIRNVATQKIIQGTAVTVLAVDQVVFAFKPVSRRAGIRHEM
jgi:hypothetical protein